MLAAMSKTAKKLDEAILIGPGDKAILSKRDTLGADLFRDRNEAEASLAVDVEEIDALQDKLWAERTRSLLVVLQGIDTSGKDGTVRGVFGTCGPLGVEGLVFAELLVPAVHADLLAHVLLQQLLRIEQVVAVVLLQHAEAARSGQALDAHRFGLDLRRPV